MKNLLSALMALAFGTFSLPAQPVTQIAAGGGHSLFLKSDGSLWAMGYNAYGQLGDGSTNNVNHPELIVASNVVAIAAECDCNHSLFLKSDGSLWGMGYNAFGQLGDGTTNNVSRPEQIVASNVTAIAAGYLHSLFLKSDGSLWGMGYNHFGALGDGTFSTAPYYGTNRPEQIIASNVVAVAAGDYHSLFIKSDGSLWATGHNYEGQLGMGVFSLMPPYATNKPQQIVASNVTAIAGGTCHSLFIKDSRCLWGMGYHTSGQLGAGLYYATNLPYGFCSPKEIWPGMVTAIAAGQSFSLFLQSDGSLWGMGDRTGGQLGDGSYGTGPFPGCYEPEKIVGSNVVAIAAGDYHSLFIKSDGSLWAMGFNGDGELGDGTCNTTNRPEQITTGFLPGYNHICCQQSGSTNLQLSFVGIAGTNYALDRSFSLSPPNWIPQVTNQAGSCGALVFSNTPDATTNNFWRVRSVP